MVTEKLNLTYKIGDLEVNRLGFGGMQLTGKGVWGEVPDRENGLKVLQRAVELGVNFIDTADSYGPYTNEKLVADALHPYKDGLVIATKSGLERPGPDEWVPNGDPDHIRKGIEGSLERLQVDQIDLWQLHRIDSKVPVRETLEPVIKAVEDGKIKYVGISEVTVDQIKEVQDLLPIVSVQNRYNLGDREWEEVLDYTTENGLAFIPWFPLASGPDKMQEKIESIAKKYDATTAQIALAWLMKRAENILLIPGTKSLEHLEENIKAAEIELTDSEFEALSK
ncbi:aldo/keto reductase [Fulvivirga sediminis]|uniref:Aldo/keto reductase n=1 Tax=Fulvivirga sediminis TaxID=2803949 RepID=A0A937JXI8_9BACT|nr:aldo/keto reductase [Fulvivirga sediminis]MBL3655523.1 aldo/keto reductase [Fulvivirga sediminis]